MDSGITLLSISQFIRDVGFPVFVAVYLLTRVETAIRTFTATMHELTELMRHVEGKLRNDA